MDFSDVRWLEVDGLKVRYLKGPERTGVPLFLTSPWPESLLAFRKIWDRLTAQTSVVAVDLPGFGQSEGRTDVLSPSGMGAILPQIMHALGLTLGLSHMSQGVKEEVLAPSCFESFDPGGCLIGSHLEDVGG